MGEEYTLLSEEAMMFLQAVFVLVHKDIDQNRLNEAQRRAFNELKTTLVPGEQVLQ